VVGSLFLENSSPEITFETGASHANWQIAAQEWNSQALQFASGSVDADATNDTFTPRLTILNGGQVGVGTATPTQARLHVVSSGTLKGIYSYAANTAIAGHSAGGYGVSGETDTGQYGVYGKSTGTEAGYGVYGSSSYGHGVFGSATTAGKAGVYGFGGSAVAGWFRSTSSYGLIVETGAVGIGTTAPVDDLHLSSGKKVRIGHGVEFSNNMSIGNNIDYAFTIAGMGYGTAEFHCGFYGGGAWLNFHVTLGGHMSSGSKIYGATILANESGGNVTITATENNNNYVIAIKQTSGGTCYGSYWHKTSTYTDGAAVATVTWASV
jgi:hypothetical protein